MPATWLWRSMLPASYNWLLCAGLSQGHLCTAYIWSAWCGRTQRHHTLHTCAAMISASVLSFRPVLMFPPAVPSSYWLMTLTSSVSFLPLSVQPGPCGGVGWWLLHFESCAGGGRLLELCKVLLGQLPLCCLLLTVACLLYLINLKLRQRFLIADWNTEVEVVCF